MNQPNIAMLRELIATLDALLADPHPGLSTWRLAYHRAAWDVSVFLSNTVFTEINANQTPQ